MLVALLGDRCTHHLVGRSLFLSAQSAIADGLLDRTEARSIAHLEHPGQASDRAYSGDSSEPLQAITQQRILLQRAKQCRVQGSHDRSVGANLQ